ncbi:sensor domain-containing diguanylate cyclase/phosphohydrolase [Desulforamulus hydrothermalis]|uniref:Diguanylate cyclase with PAS/PAC sensor n=1 Tax=Desulforamulus hydrothermalis Lam5 = DSM 18033 TaxID=1121428 RepID=K8DY18_9FIRM
MSKQFTRAAWQISLVYVLVSTGWVYFSDYILNMLVRDKHLLTIWQTYKGIVFVSATGLLLFYLIGRQMRERLAAEQALRASEEKYRNIVEQSVDGVVLADRQGRIVEWNSGMENISGTARQQVLGRFLWDVVFSFASPEKRQAALYQDFQAKILAALRCQASPLFNKPQEFVIYRPDGQVRYIQEIKFPITIGDSFYIGVIIRDVSESKQTEQQLLLQKACLQQLFDNSPNAIVMLDNEDRVVNCNRAFEEIFQYTGAEVRGRNINDLIVPGRLVAEASELSRQVLAGQASVLRETVRQKKDGSEIHVHLLGYPIFLNNRPVGLYGVYKDITEQKKAEEKLQYLSLRDSLTGLYNRTFFEQEMKRLPQAHLAVGIILCDLNGLKLVNDTMGHDTGDALLRAAADVFQHCFRQQDVIARIGGDEFAVLLPDADRAMLEDMVQRVKNALDVYNAGHPQLPLSVSVGLAAGKARDIHNLFKEADNNMYREKLHHSQSTRSAIVQTLIKALEARDFITEGHGQRLQELLVGLAQKIGLPASRWGDLRLLARFHDIGKVGIPDRLLFKPGRLTPEEVAEMQRHCEIGHRIAQSAPDLVPIADWILKHHEWWNGKGYPLGLQGEEIPLECRMLAIADAYDAMTSDRPYRRAMPRQAALAELAKGAGEQFDPHLVNVFINMMESHDVA